MKCLEEAFANRLLPEGLMSDPEYRFNFSTVAPACRSHFEEAVGILVKGGR